MAKMQLHLTKNELMDAVINYYESQGYDVEKLQIKGDRRGLTGGTLTLNGIKKGEK